VSRLRCSAGGTSVIHLASHLIEKHVGPGQSAKGLRVMLEERLRDAASPQPLPATVGLDTVADVRVRRAILLMERQPSPQPSPSALAVAAGTSARHLHRLFVAATGQSPAAFNETMRLDAARALIVEARLSLTTIAFRTGFADASHFSRRFRRRFGTTPSSLRRSTAPTAAPATLRPSECRTSDR